MRNSELIKKYKGKILGSGDANIDKDFYVEDFLDKDCLVNFIYDVFEYHDDLTEDGLAFIEDAYGLVDFAKYLYTLNNDFPSGSALENELIIERAPFRSVNSFCLPTLNNPSDKRKYENYKGKVVAASPDRLNKLYADDLLELQDAISLIRSTQKGEFCLSKLGYEFLNSYYGIDNLIKAYLYQDLEKPYRSQKELQERVLNLGKSLK